MYIPIPISIVNLLSFFFIGVSRQTFKVEVEDWHVPKCVYDCSFLICFLSRSVPVYSVNAVQPMFTDLM